MKSGEVWRVAGVARGAGVYWLSVGAHLLSLFVTWLPTGATKLLIVPALGYAVYREMGRVPLLYAAALLASWVGDYSMWVADDGLAAQGRAYFTAGVTAFGVAHGCYVWLAVGALALRGGRDEGRRLTPKPTTTVLFVSSAALVVVLEVPYLLALYAMLLAWLLLLTGTLSRKPAGPHREAIEEGAFAPQTAVAPYRAAFLGTVAFALSDGLIGLQLSGAVPVAPPWSTVAIMGLYAGGQWGLRGLATGASAEPRRVHRAPVRLRGL